MKAYFGESKDGKIEFLGSGNAGYIKKGVSTLVVKGTKEQIKKIKDGNEVKIDKEKKKIIDSGS